MARQARINSKTGIYHVMLRGNDWSSYSWDIGQRMQGLLLPEMGSILDMLSHETQLSGRKIAVLTGLNREMVRKIIVSEELSPRHRTPLIILIFRQKERQTSMSKQRGYRK